MKRVKEKIGLLSKGIFEYENPEVVVSEESLELKVEAGKLFEGFFEIHSLNGVEIRTKAFSSNKLMQLKRQDFAGIQIRVDYLFDAANLEAGEVIEGHVSIISNGGEIEIPFSVQICQPFCHTSVGPIKDLAQFTNLAQTNWHEAVKLFRSPNFVRVFLVNKKYAHIYEKLIQSRNPNQAMEEFLCTIKRKRRIDIKISQDSIEYVDLKEPVSARLVIEKSGWGYQRIFVETAGDFIQVYKKELTTEDFLGSYYQLEYVIDPSFFRQGNNYGKITVRTLYKTVEISVSCVHEYRRAQESLRKSVKESIYDIFSNYLALEMGRIEREEWLRLTREAIDGCRNQSSDPIYALMEAHFSLLIGDRDNAKELIENINGRELRHKSVVDYCYYLYVSALQREDPNYTKFAKEKIDGYYDGKYDEWELLWMKMALGEKSSVSRKYMLIKEQAEKGCISPLLYWEAVKAVNSEPSLIREFDKFEIQLMAWGLKKDCVSTEAIYQFADVASKGHQFSRLALNTLIRFCEIHEKKELIAGICALLIRGNEIAPKYNRWYRLGIEASLKLQGLYENYMYSIDEQQKQTLPVGVMIYFNYDNQLSASKKAFLYAYIIQNQDTYPKIYRDYENIMKAFTHEQLSKSYISKNMVILYKHFITPENISQKVASKLPNILFKYEIKVKNPKVRSVIVSHREMDRDFIYQFSDGRAYVDIYMDDYQLIFVDRMEYRYSGTIKYEIKPMMDASEFIKICYNMGVDDAMILMNRSERAIKYQKIDDVSIDIYKRTLKLPNVRKQYQKNVLKNLIDFYYDNYEGETLEKYLLKLDISLLDNVERGGIIEYYIQRGLFEKAYEAIVEYGYDNIQDKKLMRLCSKMIREKLFVQDELLIEMAYYAFTCGKYDDVILEYLIKYYLGTTKDLYAIWKAALDFEVNAFELEEKILCQMLFAEAFVSNGMPIFESYYKMHPDQRIVKAFLAFYSYNYLVKEKPVDEALFSYIEIECDQMNTASDVCCLALLKYYSKSEDRAALHKPWILEKCREFIERGMVLPFFKEFIRFVDLPREILDKTYVTYRTNPKHIVTIHYLCEDGDDTGQVYKEEEMRNVFGGIFVREFTLFDDEKLKYYITEKSEFSQSITESRIIDGASRMHFPKKNGKDWINEMIAMASAGEYEQLKDELQSYEEKRYLTKKLFTLMQQG